MPSCEGNLLTQRHEIWSQDTRDSRLSYGENPESLSHLGLNRYGVVTDGRTDRVTIANTRLALSAAARKNSSNLANVVYRTGVKITGDNTTIDFVYVTP